MRRPRRRLEVSTFPFLAVLLCAMGSLILLLLVLDRRAKAVARARAEEAVLAARAERDAQARAAAEAAAERAAERERLRLARNDQLARAKDELDGQLRSVEERKAGAAQATTAHRQRWRQLLEVLGNQREELAKAEREITAGRGAAAEAEQMGESARQEAARLSAQLSGLELVLDELKAARKRGANTYSLLPYRGKRGDHRRPLYVECTANGLMFHPDRQALSRIASAAEIRAAVEARVEGQRKKVLAQRGQPDQRPYLLMLVRPDGIASYYLTVAALQGREVDFGYEFIDADWVLDFPEDDTAPPNQPWMTARRTPVAPADPSAPKRKVSGMRAGRAGGELGEGDEGAPGMGSASAVAQGGSSDLPPLPGAAPAGLATGGAGSDLPPLPGAPAGGGAGRGGSGQMSGAPGAGTGAGNPSGGGVPDPDGSLRGTPRQSSGVRVAQAQPTAAQGVSWAAAGAPRGPPGTSSGPGSSASNGDLPPLPGPMGGKGQGAGGSSRPNPDGTLPGAPPPAPGGGTAPGQSEAAPPAPQTTFPAPSGSPPLFPSGGAARPAGGGSGQPGAATSEAQPAGATGATGSAGGRPGPGGASQPQDADGPQGPHIDTDPLPGRPGPRYSPPPRPLRLIGNRDWVIPVECRADGVVVRTLGQKLSSASLAGKSGVDSPLLQAVKQMIDRRQAGVRPGEPPYRPQVRFLIYPDGLRTYFLAFPALEPLGIPLTRQNAEADSPSRQSP
jgi:hypothetical protein